MIRHNAFWKGDDDDEAERYAIQVLMLAETEELLRERQKSKRVLVPPLNASECEVEEEDASVSLTQKQRERQESKKQKERWTLAKSKAYAEILGNQLKNQKAKNEELYKCDLPRKRPPSRSYRK